MPCDTVTKVNLKMDHIDLDRMKRALEGLGFSVTALGSKLSGAWGMIDCKTGVMTTSGGVQAGVIRQAYTGQIIKDQAKRMGWTLKDKGNFKYEITKR